MQHARGILIRAAARRGVDYGASSRAFRLSGHTSLPCYALSHTTFSLIQHTKSNGAEGRARKQRRRGQVILDGRAGERRAYEAYRPRPVPRTEEVDAEREADD